MKNFLFALLAGALLCGCSAPPLSQALEPAATETMPPTSTWTSTSEPTNTMTPTATATLVPLSDVDWNAIIYQVGDLPGTFAISDIERLGYRHRIFSSSSGCAKQDDIIDSRNR